MSGKPTPARSSAGGAPLQPSSGPSYTDYPLIAYFDADSKHSLIKLVPSGTGTVDLANWQRPLKLNRKEPWIIRKLAEEERKAAKERAASKEGRLKSEEDEDGDVKMEVEPAAAPAKPQRDDNLVAPGPSSKPAPGPNAQRGRFGRKKKTKQVFLAADQAARHLSKEERSPWLLEDGAPHSGERWVGRYEGSSSATTSAGESPYMIFRSTESGSFEVLPLHRVYRFTPRPTYETLETEEAEKAYEKLQKKGTKEEVGRWFMRKRPGAAMGAAVKREGASSSGLMGGPRGFRVVNGRTAAGGALKADEDEDVKPRLDGEGEFDEFDYDEEFADDEEGAGNFNDEAMDEEELKALEEKIKKEMMSAGRAGDEERRNALGDEDVLDLDGQRGVLTREGKATKKLLRKKARDEVYDSDDDEDGHNPYASEEDESDPDEDSEAASQDPLHSAAQSHPTSRAGTPSAGSHRPAGTSSLQRSSSTAHLHPPSQHRSGSSSHLNPRSRGNSPVPPTGSGSSFVAQRATSRPPGPLTGAPPGPGRSRQVSVGVSRAASRGASPAPSTPGKPTAVSGVPGNGSQSKRKYAGDASAEPRQKRPFAGNATPSGAGTSGPAPGTSTPVPGTPSGGGGTGEIQEHEVIAFLRGRGKVSVKELLSRFKARMKLPANRDIIRTLVAKLGNLSDGAVTLKEQYAV